jgi:hypothetical protein
MVSFCTIKDNPIEVFANDALGYALKAFSALKKGREPLMIEFESEIRWQRYGFSSICIKFNT